MQYKTLFLRHGYLLWKYRDYNNLSFHELRDLGLNIGMYTVDQDQKKDTLVWSYDICLTSQQKRTIETAYMLWFLEPIQREFLTEIHFDLAQLMNEEEYSSGEWLSVIRKVLWKSFFNRNPGVESPESVMYRIQLLLSYLRNHQERDVLIISHWFFLQMVKCLLLNWIDFTKIKYEEFIKYEISPLSYLDGFEIGKT